MKIYYLTAIAFTIAALAIFSVTESQPAAESLPAQQLNDYPAQDIELRAKLLIAEAGGKQSIRSSRSLQGLMEEANRIWRQAGIMFAVTDIAYTNIEPDTLHDAVNGSPSGLASVEGYEPDKINLLFVPEIPGGLNGISFPSYRAALIADSTTANSYRTVAHELGHILRLRHSPYPERLMYTGTNGELLAEEEISFARFVVSEYFG